MKQYSLKFEKASLCTSFFLTWRDLFTRGNNLEVFKMKQFKKSSAAVCSADKFTCQHETPHAWQRRQNLTILNRAILPDVSLTPVDMSWRSTAGLTSYMKMPVMKIKNISWFKQKRCSGCILMMTRNYFYRSETVKNDLVLNMTPENNSKTFQNWSEARFSSSIPKEIIQSKRHIHRKRLLGNKTDEQCLQAAVRNWTRR